jgi:hypothetical protein
MFVDPLGEGLLLYGISLICKKRNKETSKHPNDLSIPRSRTRTSSLPLAALIAMAKVRVPSGTLSLAAIATTLTDAVYNHHFGPEIAHRQHCTFSLLPSSLGRQLSLGSYQLSSLSKLHIDEALGIHLTRLSLLHESPTHPVCTSCLNIHLRCSLLP